MRTIKQLNNDFALYIQEIDRCEHAKCYLALLHVLLALPDVCASLETDPSAKPEVGKRYVEWCNAYLPSSRTVSADDRYQMRNALLHRGSTTAKNWGNRRTNYVHFSYVDPETFDVEVHDTTNKGCTILNVHIAALAAETKRAIDNWFNALQSDQVKMSWVEKNIKSLTRIQPKSISQTESDGSEVKKNGLTYSST